MSSSALASKWRQVQGENHWKGMIDPLDIELRKELIRYGELIQVMYDSLDNDVESKYAGLPRYGKSKLFEAVGLNNPDEGLSVDYNITRYFYATATANAEATFLLKSIHKDAWARQNNWNGYIAVADDKGKEWLGRRDIVVVFRGTKRDAEWVDDVHHKPVKLPPLNPSSEASSLLSALHDDGIRVAEGWVLVYNSKSDSAPLGKLSAREQVLAELKRLLEQYKDEDVSITVIGHSLGAALATLCAYDIANEGINQRTNSSGHTETIPVTSFAYASPCVGNLFFKQHAEKLPGLCILRIHNIQDLIPLAPSTLLGYIHAGVERSFDYTISPHLKNDTDIWKKHNLEAILHMVAGFQTSLSRTFKLEVDRDYALVNKNSDALQDNLLIPPNWWKLQHLGMLFSNGRWRLPERLPEDLPSMDNPEYN